MIQALANPSFLISAAAGSSGFSMSASEFSVRLDESILFETTLTSPELFQLVDHVTALGADWQHLSFGRLERELKKPAFIEEATRPERAEALESFVTSFLDVLDDPATRPQLYEPGIGYLRENEDGMLRGFDVSGAFEEGLDGRLWARPQVGACSTGPWGLRYIGGMTPLSRFENPALPGLRTAAYLLQHLNGTYLDEMEADGPHVRRGEPHEDQIFGGVPMVRTPTREPSPIEIVLFGDSIGVMPVDAQGLEQMAAFIRDFDLENLSSEQAPAVFDLARVLSQVADEQMGQAQTKRAQRFLRDAMTLLSAWRDWAAASDVEATRADLAGAVLGTWEHRLDVWRSLSERIGKSASVVASASERIRQGDYEGTIRKYTEAAVMVLGVAGSYQRMAYPILAHHVMHTHFDPVLNAAQQISEQVGRMLAGQEQNDPRRREELEGLHRKAAELHGKTHKAMFDSNEWIPTRDEDNQVIRRPEAIMIRNMVLSLEVYLGLEPTDREEFYDPAEKVGVPRHVYDMTTPFYTTGQLLKNAEARYEKAGAAQAYHELLGLADMLTDLQKQIRLAVTTLGGGTCRAIYLMRCMRSGGAYEIRRNNGMMPFRKRRNRN